MHVHTPSRYEGPVTRHRSWWQPSEGKLGTPKKSRGVEKPIRQELVARIRREIAAGTYDTPEKMAIALERLLNRLPRP